MCIVHHNGIVNGIRNRPTEGGGSLDCVEINTILKSFNTQNLEHNSRWLSLVVF